MNITVEILNLNKHLTFDEVDKMGGGLMCSDSFGYELWNFGDNENPVYVQRHVDFDGENDDVWSSDINVLMKWFIIYEDDEWITQRMK